jgi:hypothetical protein
VTHAALLVRAAAAPLLLLQCQHPLLALLLLAMVAAPRQPIACYC